MKPKITFCNRHGLWCVQIKDTFNYFPTYQQALKYAGSIVPKNKP